MDEKRAMTAYDDMLYRCGVVDKKAYWDKRVSQIEHAQPKPQPRKKPLTEQQENVIVVENGALGSVQEMLKALLATVLQRIVDRVPAQYKRDSVKMQGVPGLAVMAYLDGRQVDVIPARTEIRVEMDPNTLRDIRAIVAFDDGTYDPRDYRSEVEHFAIDWTQPVEDLVGQVVRYMNSRRRGVGA